MKSKKLFIYTDPVALGEMFSSDGRDNDLKITRYTRDQREALRMAINCLPRRELDMLCAASLWKKGQEEIARMNEVTQGDVSYRIRRARERITLWCKLHYIISEQEIRDILFFDLKLKIQDIKVVLGIYRTTSQSVCAKALGVTQGNIRHDFIKVMDLVKQNIDSNVRYIKVLKVMEVLSENYNQLRALDSQRRWIKKFT